MLFPFLGNAQVRYDSGYLVTSTGDTLRGYIGTEATSNTPDQIHFKEALTTESHTTYRPGQVRFVLLNDIASYETYAGSITMDKTALPDIPAGRDMRVRVDTILLEIVAQGKHVVLYAYKDDIKTRFFLKEQGEAVKELSFKQYYVQNGNAKTVARQEYYKAQLWLAAETKQVATKELKGLIERTDYSRESLHNIIDIMNGIRPASAIPDMGEMTDQEVPGLDNMNTLDLRRNIGTGYIGLALS